MDIEQALRVHSRLAHALLPHWNRSPEIQSVVGSLLKEWERLEVSDGEFLDAAARRLCENGVSDEGLLDAVRNAGSLPVDRYRQIMFDKALTLAKRLYEQYSAWTGGDAKLEVYPRQIPAFSGDAAFGAFGVSGCTTPGAPPHNACVVLHHIPQLLGPPSWASIPYVLCHELLCHASQAAAESDATDPFTEGWMDDVATFVHERSTSALFPWEPSFAAEEGGRLSDSLHKLTDGLSYAERKARYARMLGLSAARIVRHDMADLSGLRRGVGADTLFHQLSVELNTVPAVSPARDLADHRAFVDSVVKTARDPLAKVRLKAALRKWITGHQTAKEVLAFR